MTRLPDSVRSRLQNGLEHIRWNARLINSIEGIYDKYLFRAPRFDEISEHLASFYRRVPSGVAAAEVIRDGRELPFLGIRPLNVEMDVTNQCNIRCIMCEFSNEGFRKHQRRDMPVDEFSRIARQLFPLSHRVCLSLGAEPLLHRRFIDLLDITAAQEVPFVYFNTNGLLLTPEISARLIEHGIQAVTISIDAATKERYSRIRVGGDFDRLLANIRQLNRLKRLLGSAMPALNFGFVMMRSNIAELPQLVKLADELEVSGIIGQHVLPYAITDVEHESLSHDRVLCNQMCREAKALAKERSIEITLPEPFSETDANEAIAATGIAPPADLDALAQSKEAAQRQMLSISPGEPSKSCYFPWHFIAIDMNGNVTPCGWWFGSEPLGNIQTEDFDAIWRNERFAALRLGHLGGELPAPCRECPVGGIGRVDERVTFRLTQVEPPPNGASSACISRREFNEERSSMTGIEQVNLQVNFLDHNLPPRLPLGELRTLWLTLENRGASEWSPSNTRVAIDINADRCVELELPHVVPPNSRATLHWLFWVPPVVGRHRLIVRVVSTDNGNGPAQSEPPLELWFDVFQQVLSASNRIRQRARSYLGSSWVPGDGVSWSSRGTGFPLFAREARGCRITDMEGRTYVDCGMGFGCALLGYAHAGIQKAIGQALHSGAVLSLTHHLEYEVADMLCEIIPSAELVVFGKNGSDVCTLAVRLARVFTRRPVVLTCGYHGWQDWFAERHGFLGSGIPEREKCLVHEFEFNNIESLRRQLHAHRGNVAAVMLEPANPLEGHNGPIQDVAPGFLNELVELAHAEGALVVFDEIITGFRYPTGSVQKATGVLPDLTCLGKSLTSGMPLSALAGRREVIFPTLEQVAYGPTFKGEMYSFAAAKAALTIYRDTDVPGHVRTFGTQLREKVNQRAHDVGVPGELIGPPHLMIFAFHETDERRQELMRTLLNQELHRNGVLTYMNLFVPSAAHDELALRDLESGFARALATVREAMLKDRFASYLEIPPVHT